MWKRLLGYTKDDDGAVAVDWVVLTAVVVGMGIAVMGTMYTSSNNISSDLQGTMSEAVVPAVTFGD